MQNTAFPTMKPLTSALASLQECYAKGDPLAFLDAVTECPERDSSHISWKGLWAASMTWMYGPSDLHASYRNPNGSPSATALAFGTVQYALKRAQEQIALHLDCLARYARDVEGPDYVVLDYATGLFLQGDTWTGEAQAQRFPGPLAALAAVQAKSLPSARYLVTVYSGR